MPIDTTEGKARAIARAGLAELCEDEGLVDEAMKIYEELDDVFAKLEDDFHLAHMLTNQGSVYSQRGNIKKAIELEKKALRVYHGLKEISNEASSYSRLANYYDKKGDFAESMRHIRQAVALLRKTTHWYQLAEMLRIQGTYLKNAKNTRAALESFDEALIIARKIGNLSVIGQTISEIGMLYLSGRKLNDAARCILESIDIAEQMRDNNALALRIYRLSLIYEQQGNLQEASTMSKRALDLAKQYAKHLISPINEAHRRQRSNR